jgi:DNA-binding transcriptional ArsR family regulator
MSTIIQKEIEINNIIALIPSIARGLADDTRITILDLLYHRTLSTDEIELALKAGGIIKSSTTIRHHLEILKKAGLIEISRMKEVRGAVMKYYRANTKLLPYIPPDDIKDKNSKLIEASAIKLTGIFKGILKDKKFQIFLNSKQPYKKSCRYCNHNHYKEFLALQIIYLGIAKMFRSKDFISYLQFQEGQQKANENKKEA